ncbi:MAG: spore coat associated protein CotJA [Firmicutes bacterium]|nr:spore coat associated protein CotJA [Bacillota bacterium]
MYYCKFCGYTSNDNSIMSCQNKYCVNYSTKETNYQTHVLPDDNSALGFATVPFQTFKNIFKLDQVLLTGTVFPELYMPYTQKIINRS